MDRTKKPSHLYQQIINDPGYKDELDRVFTDKDITGQLDHTFLGFTDTYKALSKIIPKEYTVIDLGCCYAFQSYYFKDHQWYIGIDSSDCLKFTTKNSRFLVMPICGFILGRSQPAQKEFAICNYVPLCQEDEERVRRSFKNIYFFYP